MAILAQYNETLWAASPAGGTQTVPPAGAGTVTGQPHQVQPGGPQLVDQFYAQVLADQIGTVFIDESVDGVTWASANGAGTANVANQILTVNQTVCFPYVRVRFLNGATPCKILQMFTEFTG